MSDNSRIDKATLEAIIRLLQKAEEKYNPINNFGNYLKYADDVIGLMSCIPLTVELDETEKVPAPPVKKPYSHWQGPLGCFVEGTPILMADGTLKPIEGIVEGDKVVGIDGEVGAVEKTYIRQSDHSLELRYQSVDSPSAVSRLETTAPHLFWVGGDDPWRPAGELQPGDRILLDDGNFADVLESLRRPDPTVVYNFDVKGPESYFANGVLVHQKCEAEMDRPAQPEEGLFDGDLKGGVR